MTNSYFARPFDTTKTGFYFANFTEYTTKAEASGAEELELMYIDGDMGQLFDACKVDQCNLEFWFDSVEDLTTDDQAKLYFLLSNHRVKLADAIDQLDDVMLDQGILLDVATDLFNEFHLHRIPADLQGYVDYEAYARDLKCGGDMTEFKYQGIVYTCTNSSSL